MPTTRAKPTGRVSNTVAHLQQIKDWWEREQLSIRKHWYTNELIKYSKSHQWVNENSNITQNCNITHKIYGFFIITYALYTWLLVIIIVTVNISQTTVHLLMTRMLHIYTVINMCPLCFQYVFNKSNKSHKADATCLIKFGSGSKTSWAPQV